MHKLSENIKEDVMMNFATLNNSANTPLWVSMKNYDAARIIIFSQTLAAGAALTCQLRQATSSGGAGAKNVTGYSTSFTDAEDDKLKGIDFRAENLDTNNGFTYVGVLITETGSKNAAVAALIIRERARYAQASLPA